MNPVNQTKKFVEDKFKQNPGYSFGDWHIMYNHSVMVKDIALKIREKIEEESDVIIVAVFALLHDIGKTMTADEETLHKKHESFNLKIASELLGVLEITADQRYKLSELLSGENEVSIEAKIVRDADALALYRDEVLFNKFIDWAIKIDLEPEDILRKTRKYDRLNFPISREIGEEDLENMKFQWKNKLILNNRADIASAL